MVWVSKAFIKDIWLLSLGLVELKIVLDFLVKEGERVEIPCSQDNSINLDNLSITELDRIFSELFN